MPTKTYFATGFHHGPTVVAATLFFWTYGVERARREINIGARHPVGPWWNPVAKYVFVGIATLIVLLQIIFRIG